MSILEGFKKLTTSRTLGMQIFKGVQVDGISDGRLLLSFEYRDDADYKNKLEKLQKAFSSLRLGFFDTSKKDIGLSYSDAKIPNGTSATFAVDVQGITENVEAPFLTFLASFSKSKTAVQDITGFDFKKLDKIPHATSASPQQDQAEAEAERQRLATEAQRQTEAERQRQEQIKNPAAATDQSGAVNLEPKFSIISELSLAAIGRSPSGDVNVYTSTIGDSPVFAAARKADGTFVIQQITTDENFYIDGMTHILRNYVDKNGIRSQTPPLAFTEQELRNQLNVDATAQLAIITACDGILDGLDWGFPDDDTSGNEVKQQYDKARQDHLDILAAYLTKKKADIDNLAPDLLDFALSEDPSQGREKSKDNISAIAVPIASVPVGKMAVSIVCDGNQGSNYLSTLAVDLQHKNLENLAKSQEVVHQQDIERQQQEDEALRVQPDAKANVVILMPPQPPPRPKTRQKINQRNVTATVLVAGGLLGTAGLAWWGWSNLVKNQTPITPTASIPQKIDISGTFQTKTQNFATDVLQLKWGVKPASTDSFDVLKAAMANGGDAQGGSTANNVKTALEAIAKKYNSDRPGLNLNVDDMLAAYRQGREASAADVPSRINGALGGVQKYIDQHQKVAALPDTDNPLSTFLGNIGKKTQDVIGAILPRGEAAVAAEVNVGAKPQINGEGTNWLSGLSVLAAGSAIAELVSGTAKSNADKAHAITRLAATMPQNLQHFAAVAQNAAQIMPSVAKEALQAVASNIQHAAPALQHAAPLLTLAAVAADIYKSSRPEFLENSKEAFAAAQERVAKAEAVTNASFTEHAGRLLRGGQRNAAALTLKKAEILNNGRENLEAGLQNIQKNMEALKTQTVQSDQGSIVVLQKNTEQMVSKASHSVNELRNAVVQQSQGTLVSIQDAGSKTLDTLKGLFNRGSATRNTEQQALMEAQLAYVTSNVR